jgi:hypothetical protein
MFGNKNLFTPVLPGCSHGEDAVFVGWQKNDRGDVFPLYTIMVSGHPSYGSTVSGKTLLALNLQIPPTPPYK